MEYTKAGNPKPPNAELINAWVRDAWQAVPNDTMRNSVNSAGFALNHADWDIAKHEIYGPRFVESWEQQYGAGLNKPDSSISEGEDDFFVVEDKSDND